MKKLLSICLALVICMGATSAFAAPGGKPGKPAKPGGNVLKNVAYYISRWGVQWDAEGDVQTRDTAHFSECVGESELTKSQKKEFSVVIGASKTEADVLSYVKESPSDDEVFEALHKEFRGAELYSSTGKLVDWDDLTSETYEIEWYVLKYETDAWHVDGRILEIETQKDLNIVLPEEREEFFEEVLPDVEMPEFDEPVEEEPEEPEVTEPEVTEPEVTEPEEEDESIHLYGATYAYIFGYEPNITRYYDEFGTLVTTAEIEMGMDDDVTVEQVSSMLMRMLDQSGNTMDAVYPITPAVAPHAGQWYERGLAYLCSVGGFDDDEVIKLESITRGQVAKLVACALKLNLSSETPFTDIEDNKYKEYIEKVYRYGYMTGESDEKFAPNAIMTRAEFCALFNNIIGRNDFGLTAKSKLGVTYEVTAEDYYFVDMDPNHWAYEVCLKATSAYDKDGYIDLETRLSNIRNVLDQHEAQKEY